MRSWLRFHMNPWRMSCLMDEQECKRWTTQYEEMASHIVGNKLRHGVGAETVPKFKDQDYPKVPGLMCDETYWVNIETLFGVRAPVRFGLQLQHDSQTTMGVQLHACEDPCQGDQKRLRFEILALIPQVLPISQNSPISAETMALTWRQSTQGIRQ